MVRKYEPERLHGAWRLLDSWIDDGLCPAFSAVVGDGQGHSDAHWAGRGSLETNAPLAEDAIFLIASPTKPLVALAVLMLAERGELLLVDSVSKYVPQFSDKDAVTLAHCLTHTSGLPDMLPENLELRREHAELSEFVRRVCGLSLDFEPGHGVQYQSMGLLMLGEVVSRISGWSLPEFLRRELFEPLGMRDTALGMPPSWEEPGETRNQSRKQRIAEIRISDPERAGDYGWNSDYWRRLGAPWGGLLSTARDWSKLCAHLLTIHQGHAGIISPSTLSSATRNYLQLLPHVPEHHRRTTPWGLGWQLNWPGHRRTFGDFLSGSAYGHWGATGTMVWIDPARDVYAVLLTSEPLEPDTRRQALFSNAFCAAVGV